MKSPEHPASVVHPAHANAHPGLIPRTPEVILGPFYPADRVAPRTRDLTTGGNRDTGAAGVQILVCVDVIDEEGNPHEGVYAEFWQANASGRYRHELDEGPAPLDSSFDGFGSQLTDALGRFSFKTVKPGTYRTPAGETRAPHVHFQLTDGARRLVTQMFFPGESLNEQDRCLRSCRDPASLIARAAYAANGQLPEFSWQVVLSRRPPLPLFSTLTESHE